VRGLSAARGAEDPYTSLLHESAFIGSCLIRWPDESHTGLWAAIRSKSHFVERLVWFWSNHFAISILKPRTAVFAVSFQWEAIRPHVLGHFADMLLAVIRHPAMLIYLDNYDSVGPSSEIGLREQRGGNENLGREVLELHTLGVNGGYTQQDVQALSAILTGWNVPVDRGRNAEPTPFQFRPEAHEPGAFELLGKNYREGGIEQGEQALRDLATHPSTARHIAWKLARHFVADQPPAALVDRLVASFTQTGGDLRALAWSLVESPEAWAPERRKLRSPIEFWVAVARACALEGGGQLDLFSAAGFLSQPPIAPTTPAGYPDNAEAWASSESVLRRIKLSIMTAANSKLDMPPVEFALAVLGNDISSRTLECLANAPRGPAGLGLVLASPEFQWR
jgi:uncharacterized protein (DUF1800 family)